MRVLRLHSAVSRSVISLRPGGRRSAATTRTISGAGCWPVRSIWTPWRLCGSILVAWRGYTDESVGVIANDGEPHNTIIPIARRRGEDYELDLVLRCNITTAEHPLGVFHPHADKHHIKKENIGLIEVMASPSCPAV